MISGRDKFEIRNLINHSFVTTYFCLNLVKTFVILHGWKQTNQTQGMFEAQKGPFSCAPSELREYLTKICWHFSRIIKRLWSFITFYTHIQNGRVKMIFNKKFIQYCPLLLMNNFGSDPLTDFKLKSKNLMLVFWNSNLKFNKFNIAIV